MKISKVKNRQLYSCSVRKPDGGYKKIYGKTKKEVREKAESLAFNIKSGKFVEDGKTTFGEWNHNWLENYLINVTEGTKKLYARIISNHINPALGEKNIQRVTHNDIQVLINKLSKTLSPKTIRNIHLVVHRSLRDAKLNGYIATNPADDIILPKLEKKEMEVLSKDEVRLFLKAAYKEYPYYADCFEFLILTGLRLGEFIGLPIEAYDPETRELKIVQQYSPIIKKLTPPKHDVFRTIVLGKREHEIITKHIREVRELEGLDPSINKDHLVFLNPYGERINDCTLRRILKKVAAQIGKPNLRLHDLRHTNATLALASGVDIKTIACNLGHATPEFTLHKYAHSTKDMQKNGANKLNEYLY